MFSMVCRVFAGASHAQSGAPVKLKITANLSKVNGNPLSIRNGLVPVNAGDCARSRRADKNKIANEFSYLRRLNGSQFGLRRAEVDFRPLPRPNRRL